MFQSIIAPSHGLIWTKSGVVIGVPTYEASLIPPVAQVLGMAVTTRVMNKKACMFGSYGWSGGASIEIKKIIEHVRWELVDIFEFAGGPKKDYLKKGEEFGVNLEKMIKS